MLASHRNDRAAIGKAVNCAAHGNARACAEDFFNIEGDGNARAVHAFCLFQQDSKTLCHYLLRKSFHPLARRQFYFVVTEKSPQIYSLNLWPPRMRLYTALTLQTKLFPGERTHHISYDKGR